MPTRSFLMTAENIMGAGCLADAMTVVQSRGFKHAPRSSPCWAPTAAR